MTPGRSQRDDATQPDAELLATLLELYEEAPCGYLSTTPDGTIVRVNGTFLAWTGYTREQLLDRRRFADLLTVGGRIYHETHYAPLLALQGSVREIAVELRRADGGRLPVLVNSVLKRAADGAPLLIRTTVFDATERRGYEQELLLARDRERAMRDRTDRLQRLTAALAARLRASEIADAVEQELAGIAWAASVEVLLPRPVVDGQPAEQAAALGEQAAALGERAPRFPGDPGAPDGSVVLPLLVAERALGAIVLEVDPAAGFDRDDRGLLRACAVQAALALDRAALHEQEAEIAHVLQRSMMEAIPLHDARIRLGAHYSPAIETLEIGGDWHDAFPIGPDRIGVVVGDVVGRGIRASTAMGQLRSAARALGGAGLGGPARVLEQLDRFAQRLPLALMATLVFAEIDLSDGTTRFACAGHPPPLLLPPDGEPVILWEGRSLPLGVTAGARRPDDAELTLTAGARLLLYTDGLVERRHESPDDGFRRLAAHTERMRRLDPQELVDGLVEALVDATQSRDDVCALCIELTGGARASAR